MFFVKRVSSYYFFFFLNTNAYKRKEKKTEKNVSNGAVKWIFTEIRRESHGSYSRGIHSCVILAVNCAPCTACTMHTTRAHLSASSPVRAALRCRVSRSGYNPWEATLPRISRRSLILAHEDVIRLNSRLGFRDRSFSQSKFHYGPREIKFT